MTSRVIQIEEISKTYGDLVAVDRVSFDVHQGEVFGLIGPNGAGKTTTLECVEGLRSPDAGRIRVLGRDPLKRSSSVQARIGVQLQEAQLQKRIKVWEAIDLWASVYPQTIEVEALIRMLGLEEKRQSWFMHLSGGQKQRLFIALALINDPEVVFLDELTTGLDPQARRRIWDIVLDIRERGKTVLLTTHLMEEAERLCDRVAIIDHGRIVDIGAPRELVRRHCPERTVVLDPVAATEPPSFDALAGLISVESVEGIITLHGTGDDFVSAVIEFLAAHSIRVRDLRTLHPNLEDVFLRLTGHSLRD